MITIFTSTFRPFDICSKPIIPSVQKSTPEGLDAPLFPARWTWLKDVTYRGSVRFRGKTVDLWTYLFNVSFCEQLLLNTTTLIYI